MTVTPHSAHAVTQWLAGCKPAQAATDIPVCLFLHVMLFLISLTLPINSI